MRNRILGAALVVTAGVAPVRPGLAQASGGGSGSVSAAADVGARTFTTDPNAQERGRFEEYRDMRSGLLLQQLLLGFTPVDSFRLFQLVGHNVALRDQSLGLRISQPGLFDVQIRSDLIPHDYSTTARSLGTTVSPGVYTLPSPRPDSLAWQAAPYIGPVRSRWDPLKAGVTFTPAPQWDFKAEYTRIGKSGNRPIGMAFGGSSNNSREILEPLDQTVNDFRITPSYTGSRFNLMATYGFSQFDNALTSITSDNPQVITDTPTAGSSRGRTALAPSNSAQSAVVTAALKLPRSTRVSGTLSYGWQHQDQALIPATINSAITDARLASIPDNPGLEVRTTQVSLSASSRPLKALNFSARYRSYQYRNNSAQVAMPLLIISDRSIAAADTNEQVPYTRDNADVSLRYRVVTPLALTVGWAWERWVRDPEARNVHRLGEHTPRVSLDFTGIEWATVRATVSKGWRRGSEYQIEGATDLVTRREFNEANRDRTRGSLLLMLTPLDQITLTTDWTVGHDEYPETGYGVQSDNSTEFGGDIAWSPTDRLSAGMNYMLETFDTRQRGRYRTGAQLDNLTYDWVGNNTDRITTVGADVTAILVPDRLEAGASYTQSRSRFQLATANPQTPTGGTAAQNANATAVNFPVVSQKMEPLGVFARYRFSELWAVTVRFQGEVYDHNDFRTFDLLPQKGNHVFLANDYLPYNARYFTFTFSYRPGVMRPSRSTM
jgi:MtrB/PioB family decaheme-associated outer membrane protein